MIDFLREYPRDLAANVAYRIRIREMAETDATLRADIMDACREDVMVWLSMYAWLHEPRDLAEDGPPRPKIIPFVPWDHQIPVIQDIKKHLGKRDIGIEKSRGEGMSWIGILLALHQWLFSLEPVNIGLVSSTEKKADNPGNMDSLMSKLDWELEQLPGWMSGKPGVDYTRNKSHHTLVNERTHSQIVAFAAVEGVGRGGRYTWFLMDELSEWERGPDEAAMKSTQQATKSRLVIATPLGTDGAYYKFMHTASNKIKLVMDWKDNPSKNRGLYQLVNDKPVAVDPGNNPLPASYNPPTKEVRQMWRDLRERGFVLEGRVRSPWYDNECYRGDSTPTSIAQELDRDYGGSVMRWFGETAVSVAKASVKPPLSKGKIRVTSESLTWDSNEFGDVLLWCPLDVKDHPPKGSYTAAADVATGQQGKYSSNSVLIVVNNLTGEQVLEYATNSVSASDFADHAVAICKWFHNAYLAWEHMGPGVAFGNRVLNDLMYGHCMQRSVITKQGRQKTKDYGYINRGDMRVLLFEDAKEYLIKGKFKILSDALAAELPQYVVAPGNKISHEHELGVVDPSHGDRVISMGVAIHAMQDRFVPNLKPDEHMLLPGQEPPKGTLAHILWEIEHERNSQDGWDRRTGADMARAGAA